MMMVSTPHAPRRLVLSMVFCGALMVLPHAVFGAGVDESPCTENPCTENPCTENPCTENPCTEVLDTAGPAAGCRLCQGLLGRQGAGSCRRAGGCQGAVVDGGEVGAVRCGMPAPPYPVPFATPRPTVPTHFTYPPMMPHNSLHHYRGTYSYRHAEGLSRTNVHWRSQKGLNALRYLHHAIELPR